MLYEAHRAEAHTKLEPWWRQERQIVFAGERGKKFLSAR
jgi:hypothetical protein